jgi:tRNA modification GTPase
MSASPLPPGDTIAAVATAPGRGGVGVLRLSGPAAFDLATVLAGSLPAPRQAGLRTFCDADGQPIDRGLVLVFAGPASFTGEDVVELQGHGSAAALDALLRAACRLGARVARPGEFSERAFVNGKLDLAQAEAIVDLVDAGSARAARAAFRAMEGGLSTRVAALAEGLIEARVFIEGALDFSDEAIDWLADAGLTERLDQLERALAALLRDAQRGRALQQGLRVVLSGAPNVGKSTLLNRLAGVDAAIVTDLPGTTRDLLREQLTLDGLPVTLIDTAGLRDTDDVIEAEGIRRAWSAIDTADLVWFLVDDRSGMSTEDQALLQRLDRQRCWVLANKTDLSGGAVGWRTDADPPVLGLAAKAGDGIPELIAALHRHAGLNADDEPPFTARTRHVDALRRCAECVTAARAQLADETFAELAAEELRLAHDALGEITGRFSSEDLLGRIFAGFCIGK